MVSDAKKRAISKYKKEKTHAFSMRFFPSDEDIWNHLSTQPRKADYVRNLIREDMERNRREKA